MDLHVFWHCHIIFYGYCQLEKSKLAIAFFGQLRSSFGDYTIHIAFMWWFWNSFCDPSLQIFVLKHFCKIFSRERSKICTTLTYFSNKIGQGPLKRTSSSRCSRLHVREVHIFHRTVDVLHVLCLVFRFWYKKYLDIVCILVHIYRSVVKSSLILLPLLGATCALGVLLVNYDTIVYPVIFAVFYSLQVKHSV